MTHDPALYRSPAGYAAVMALYDAALARGPVPYDTRWVQTRYGPTHVVVGGPAAGRPVVLFHGWNGNAAGIGADFPFLFDAFRVYIPDIIGHAGKSAPQRPPTAGAAYADWAGEVFDGLDLPRALVAGSSGGGWMALKLAAHYPQRVVRAVAISTDGLSDTNAWGMLYGMLPVALFPNRTTAQWFLEFATAPNTPKGGQAQAFADGMRILLKHFKTQGNPGRLSEGELRRITAPLLVLMGQYERIFKPAAAVERARRLIPGLVSAEIVPTAGHLVTVDQPEWLKERVLRFFDQGW